MEPKSTVYPQSLLKEGLLNFIVSNLSHRLAIHPGFIGTHMALDFTKKDEILSRLAYRQVYCIYIDYFIPLKRSLLIKKTVLFTEIYRNYVERVDRVKIGIIGAN